MSIRNLVNPESFNITNCEAEPIHLPGSIQPFGYLFGLKGEEYLIHYCSQNCSDLLGREVKEILGQPLRAFLPVDQIAAFNKYYAQRTTEHERPFVFSTGGLSYHATFFTTGDVLVLELEPLSDETFQLPDIYVHTKRFTYHTQRADNMQMLCQDIADETRQLTGLDRVMIYRFDKDNNGHVFAESRREGLESFLDLHYPASDIPVQARALYLRNQIRLIADINYEPVPLYGLDEATQLDLSQSFLRSVSPMHVQYLKNMGVGASFSVSIVYHGKLWGLIACHHYSPKRIPYYTRLAAHLQGIFLSSQIDVRIVADEFELVKQTEKTLDEIRDMMAQESHGVDDAATLERLRTLIGADGFFVRAQKQLYKSGLLPDDSRLLDLCNWLGEQKENIFRTTHLSKEYPGAAQYHQQVAGLLSITLGKGSGNFAVWTRSEVEKTVKWGGDPNKAVSVDAVTQILTPRKSFEIWKESVRHQSLDWKKAELNAATVICSSIQHHLHLNDLKEEEKRYRNLNERLQKANEELANMNWISTHDLKEPLRKIQLYASIVLEDTAGVIPEAVKLNVSRMQRSAAKMQLLIEDLLSYVKVVNEDKQYVRVDLNSALEEVQSELQEMIEEKGAQLRWQQLPVVQGIPFQIRQLFINLISNSLKFVADDRPPVITISSESVTQAPLSTADGTERTFHKISVQDNGVGFDPAHRENLFKIFQRFHPQRYKGSGIGLAICKKIAEAHNGIIEADGKVGEGAVFSIYLPQTTGVENGFTLTEQKAVES